MESIHLSVSKVALQWLSEKIIVNSIVLILFLFTLINSVLIKSFSVDGGLIAVIICNLLLFTIILFINLYLFVLFDKSVTSDNSLNLKSNYVNWFLFSMICVFEFFAIVFALMYNSKVENMVWFYCFTCCLCLAILGMAAGMIINFIDAWKSFWFWYFPVFIVGVILFVLTFNKNIVFMSGFLNIIAISIMFSFNFKELFSPFFVLEVNKNYYVQKLVPEISNDYVSYIKSNLNMLSNKINDLTSQMNFIYENYICNQSINIENSRYIDNLSQLQVANMNIQNFNSLFENNIDNTGNISNLNQRLLSIFNVAKSISGDYSTFNLFSFIQWIYQIIALVKSSAYVNRRDTYINEYVIDGNFSIANQSDLRINLSMNMSLIDLMNRLNMNSATITNNVVKFRNNTVAGICSLFDAVIFQNIFEFCNFNWNSNGMFSVNMVYNMVPYCFIFNGTLSNSNLVGMMTNNYILYLFDSSTNTIYFIDFINKTYEIYKYFSIFNSSVYNSTNVYFSIKNSESSNFFQKIGKGFFDTLNVINNDITYEVFNTNNNNLWLFDCKDNVNNDCYMQIIEIMNANNQIVYKVFNESDTLQFNGVTMLTINEAAEM